MLQRRKKGSFYCRPNKCFFFFFLLNHGCQLVAPSTKSDYLSLRFVSSLPPRDILSFTHCSCWCTSHWPSKKRNGEGISHPTEETSQCRPSSSKGWQTISGVTYSHQPEHVTQAAYTDGTLYQSPHLEDIFV